MNEQELRETIGIAMESALADSARGGGPWAALVWQGEQTLYQGASGLTPEGAAVSIDTLFDIGRLTELFTLTAFLRMVDEGRLWLDTPVEVLLPDLPTELRFLDLITHHSGLATRTAFDRLPNLERRLEALETLTLQVLPSTLKEPRYSPYDYMLVGLALEALTSMPLDLALAQSVFQPLGLSAAFAPLPHLAEVVPVRPPERIPADPDARALNHVAGHNGLFASARDMAALAQIYLPASTDEDGIQAPSRFFPPPIAHEALKEHLPGQGFAWALRAFAGAVNGDADRRLPFMISETGCMVALDPQTSSGIAVVSVLVPGSQGSDGLNALPGAVLSLIE